MIDHLFMLGGLAVLLALFAVPSILIDQASQRQRAFERRAADDAEAARSRRPASVPSSKHSD